MKQNNLLPILLVSIILFPSFCPVPKGYLKRKIEKLPIYLNFAKPVAADSVSSFAKVYFKTKGINVIEKEELLSLIQSETRNVLNDALNKGENILDIGPKVADMTEIVANNLTMRVFQNQQNIDSIQWSIFYSPVNKSRIGLPKQFFYPKGDKQVYKVLKEFTDTLIHSPLYK